MTPHMQRTARSEHTGEQEPSGPGHHTRKTMHRAGTLVNRSQVAQNTAHTTHHTERAEPMKRSQVAQDTEHATQQAGRAHW